MSDNVRFQVGLISRFQIITSVKTPFGYFLNKQDSYENP